MKLKFKNQQFQTDAVNAVADLFSGQEKMQSTFEITQGPQLSLVENELGIGNGILISENQLEKNMNEIQKRNNLPNSSLEKDKNNYELCIMNSELCKTAPDRKSVV